MCKSLKDIVLKDSNSINIRDCYVHSGIEEILATLNKELVGLEDVKKKIREIASVLLLDRIREIKELPAIDSSLHMVFTGKSGTGKSVVAKKMAVLLRNLGYLTKGHILNVTREDLVGQYVGHTAPKTKEQLQKAHGGILFLDDAHQLYKIDNERDYGSEAVELLLQIMENQRDDLVLIFSGEKDKMQKFFKANPGISSRIGNYVDFQDYTVHELTEITKFLLDNELRYKITPQALEILVFYINQLIPFGTFANVRTVKVLLNQVLAYQSLRIEKLLAEKGKLDFQSLISIQEEDFSYFTPEDFINIIGSENIQLYKK